MRRESIDAAMLTDRYASTHRPGPEPLWGGDLDGTRPVLTERVDEWARKTRPLLKLLDTD